MFFYRKCGVIKMPRKGTKRGLSAKSSDGVRKKLERLCETELERSERQADQQKRQATKRENETEQERAERLEAQRVFDAKRRKAATPVQRELRNNEKKANRSEALKNESVEAGLLRKHNDKERHATLRQKKASDSLNKTRNIGVVGDLGVFKESDIPSEMAEHVLPSLYEANNVCSYCKAYRWSEERPGFCCEKGQIRLPACKDIPEKLKALYDIPEFLQNIRSYNNAVALASIGCHEEVLPGFSPTFKIHGKVFHRIGSLKPPDGQKPKFAQIYFHDTEHEVDNRLDHNPHLNRSTLQKLQDCLKVNNTYVQSLMYASELSNENPDVNIVIHAEKRPQQEHSRRYNIPTGSEVAVIMPGDQADHLDIVLQTQTGKIQRINTLHRAYDPLHYVVLFPYGEDGYTENLLRANGKKHLSPTEYHRYQLQVRQGSDNWLMKSKRLTQQFATDGFAKAEGQRLRWIRANQKEIRADKYKGLLDAVDAHDEINAGKRVILPPSITGTPRWYSQCFQDSMAVVRKYGRPDYFVTYTTNPKAPEIESSIFPGQKPCDRPDISDRVFNIKHENLLKDLMDRQVLGEVAAFTSMKEDQKRGLPHAHILLFMADKDKPRTPEQIDRVISAEIPDKNINPKLHEIVTKHMIHGPCGEINDNCSCMEKQNNGKKECSKEFPKDFADNTKLAENGYPQYRRRSPEMGGNTHTMKVKGNEFTADNRWVVPHNPFLCLRYNAHINVEVVSSVQCVKYICKYTCKGSDRVIVTLANGQEKDITNDEVERFQNARYVSASEAYWRLYEFPISRRYPAVEKLPLHLEDEQVVYFQSENAKNVATKPAPETKLTAYFKLNAQSTDSHHVLYPDIYQHYTWNQEGRKWVKRRNRMTKKKVGEEHIHVMSDTIGRIPIINLSACQSEIYFLRMLLYHRAGATSYADLRTVNGVEEATFQAACLKMGILDNEDEIDKVLEEAASVRFGAQLREVFATLLIWVKPADPRGFWQKHQALLCEDLLHRDGLHEPNESILNEVLLELEEHVQRNGLDLENFNLPKPNKSLIKERIPREIREETNYDTSALTAIVQENVPKFNSEQRDVYQRVMKSIEEDLGEMIAIEAPGGTGKTFLISTILAKVRSEKQVALATATSGIAATLLMNGRTIHSRCKVPIENLNAESFCNITKRDATAELIRRCKVIVMDEDTMAHKHVFEAVERTFRDLRGNDRPFGGCTTVPCGDWRQTLPVVKRGSRADITEACLKSSELWKEAVVMKLSKNMRLKQNGKDAEEFAKKLLAIGEGREPTYVDLGQYKIRIDDELLLENETLESLCDFVWEGLMQNYSRPEWLCSRAVLCPTNEAAEEVNSYMIKGFPGEGRDYKSSDKLTNESKHHQFPEEFLNTIRSSGLPPHTLSIKKHCPIMLIRNLDPIRGHCNGTRYIVNEMHDHVIDATVATGVHVGRRIFIPRIPMTPSDSSFPFEMIRRQYPVRVCFGLTSNKSQGQTLEKIGIYLKKDFFSHGQLYVALSRAKEKKNIRILSKNGHYPGREGVYTDNVVFHEVLS